MLLVVTDGSLLVLIFLYSLDNSALKCCEHWKLKHQNHFFSGVDFRRMNVLLKVLKTGLFPIILISFSLLVSLHHPSSSSTRFDGIEMLSIFELKSEYALIDRSCEFSGISIRWRCSQKSNAFLWISLSVDGIEIVVNSELEKHPFSNIWISESDANFTP